MLFFSIFDDDSYTRFITPLHTEEKLYGISNQHIDNAMNFYQKLRHISVVFPVGYGRIRTAFRLCLPSTQSRRWRPSLSKSFTIQLLLVLVLAVVLTSDPRASVSRPSFSSRSLPPVSVARRPCNQSHKKYTKGSGNVSVPRVS